LPPAIAIYDLFPVAAEDHARYSAVSRTYHYHIIDRKDPFLYDQRYHYYGFHQLQTSEMQTAAMLLMDYDAFYPFCKAHSGVKHYRCELQHATWSFTPHEMIFEITANRFLRGMVRLIVGMCIQVGMGKMAVDHVREALEQQTPLSGSWSVPPEGLFLTDIRYSFLKTRG
jgi:tRNA pseudouridine38-40 synthase